MKFAGRGVVVATLGLALFLGLMVPPGGTLAEPGQPVIKPPGDSPAPGGRGRLERVLIRASRPYTTLVEAIRKQGGIVTHEYRNFDGLAARIPRESMATLTAITGAAAISKDLLIRVPKVVDRGLTGAGGPVRRGDAKGIPCESSRGLAAAEVAALAGVQPDAYALNASILNVSDLHASGVLGLGVIVAVIDSGIRPGFFHLESDLSVLGGEDFVGDGLGFSDSRNNGHGTFVAGMISANALFGFAPSSPLFRAVEMYAPEAIVNLAGTPLIPMIGSAPGARIYAMRVFPPSGGTPTSVVLAAVDRTIELRKKFDAGDPEGVNIRVANMSLSGPTLFAGRNLFDLAIDAMVANDIVVTNSAGNAGPSSLTIGSPGSALSTITVGAASLAHNERIVRTLQFFAPRLGLGIEVGGQFRPYDGTETAVFSSRGPNADGRGDPDVTVNGDWNYGMGFLTTADVSFSGGTSFSAPTVAGVAALLRQAFPKATALQVRNAIIATANPDLLADGSTSLDQGAGYVDARAAFEFLGEKRKVKKSLTKAPKFKKKVVENLKKNAHLRVDKGVVNRRFDRLKPGERGEILYEVPRETERVVISLSNVMPELPPSEQNFFFHDDILLTVHSAKTSRQPGDGDYLVDRFTLGDTFVVLNPERGVMRITLSGDWTNAGAISADVTVFSVRERLPGTSTRGRITDLETIEIPVQIPPGVSLAEFRLVWGHDWSRYPVNDIDLILVGPDGRLDFQGATLDEPEIARVPSPMPGEWTVVLFGFELHTRRDKYKLRITLDDELLGLP